jgi:hypothetical protein
MTDRTTVPQADFVVRSPHGDAVLAVEVKGGARPSTADWAAEFRGNLLSASMLPDGLPFLLVTPSTLYYWGASPAAEPQPDAMSDARQMLSRYLPAEYRAADAPPLRETSLEMVVSGWLDAMTQVRPGDESDPGRRWLSSIGLLPRLAQGLVQAEALT